MAAHVWVRDPELPILSRCSVCGWGWKWDYDNDFECPGKEPMTDTPRWALWNYETEQWDEVPAENAPGTWLGGHAYLDPEARYEPILPALSKTHGLLQIVMCAWIEGHGWLTSRRGLSHWGGEAQDRATIEVAQGLRAMQHRLDKEGIALR